MIRRRPIGAELSGDGVEFRVWAPAHERMAVVIDGRDHPLERESGGYFCGTVRGARAGTLYRYRVGNDAYPDPASRFQPEGPHGPSEVIDPTAYVWRDGDWKGIRLEDLVISEVHIGTFTREGTYAAIIPHLRELADAGINCIEVMPLHEFGGTFGWGYDGVDLWAPSRLYGRPDDLRRFVDEAHLAGIGVVLDVVYNHFGPDGCYVTQFTPHYFTDKYENDWGASVNFDGEDSGGVREFVAENAAYWIDEFHFDGLRLDATQSLNDASERHVLCDISARARDARRGRGIVLLAENEPQDRRILDEQGIDAMWNDDWHHAARVALTGGREAYYTDYTGRAHEFVAMARHGFLYQGQRYSWQKGRRGTPSGDIAPPQLVCYLQNHDQLANSADGARLHQRTSPGRFRAMTALLLLQPQTPMLFQGEEFGASAPFLYFADHEPELAQQVYAGRKEFLAQFPSYVNLEIDPPHARETFERCKLDHSERETNADVVALYRELIALRRTGKFAARPEGAVINDDCFLLRWPDRLLLVNLGRQIQLDIVDEPLLAPPPQSRWKMLWATETMPEPEDEEGVWTIAGESAIVLAERSAGVPAG